MFNIINFIIFNNLLKNLAFKVLRSGITKIPLYQFIYQKRIDKKIAKYNKKPSRINIENTNICTANCTFCSHQNMKRKQGIMDMELFKKVVDDAVGWDIDCLVLTGFGEPLLDPHFFERVAYCRKKGVRWVTANANARFISKTNAFKLLESGIDEVYVSCNKLGEENAKRFCNIKHFYKYKKPLIYLSGMKGEFEPPKYKGADGVSISFLHNWAGGVDKNMPSSMKDPCKLLWHTINIMWDGRVTICCIDYEGEYVLGDLKRNSLEEVWFGELSLKYKQYHKKRNYDIIPICKKCTYNCHYKSPWWI